MKQLFWGDSSFIITQPFCACSGILENADRERQMSYQMESTESSIFGLGSRPDSSTNNSNDQYSRLPTSNMSITLSPLLQARVTFSVCRYHHLETIIDAIDHNMNSLYLTPLNIPGMMCSHDNNLEDLLIPNHECWRDSKLHKGLHSWKSLDGQAPPCLLADDRKLDVKHQEYCI